MVQLFSAIKNSRHPTSNRGFTFIEVLAAIFIVTVGLGGTLALIQTTISSTSFSSSKLTAAYLAQEGVEIIRHIRDTNWLENRTATTSWNEGLADGQYETDYTILGAEDPALDSYQDRFLKLDSNGFNYSSGQDTKFKRKITISEVSSDEIKVRVRVEFQYKGHTHSVVAQEHIYNWY